ncbi:MAG: hypothetical protein IPN34_25325 [Planctomycetes bacterium]|nr:hypothetical protein [Planctomycetota bacterium]
MPAFLGCGAFAAWLLCGGVIDELGSFAWVGIAGLYLGVFTLPAGCFALLVARARGAGGRSLAVRSLWMLGNLPLAGLCLAGVLACTRVQLVEVRNTSGAEITDVRLFGAGDGTWPTIMLPHLAAGETQRVAFWLVVKDALSFSYLQRGLENVARSDEQVGLGPVEPKRLVLEIGDGGQREMVARDAGRWHWFDLRFLVR